MNPSVTACAAAAVSTALALVVLVRAAPALRLVDRPDGRHAHARPTPRIGGLAIAFGATVGVLLAGAAELPVRTLLAAAGLLAIGVVDDVVRDKFPPLLKLAFQIGAAAFVAEPFGLLDGAIVALFLVAATNAFNFFDHAHGLLALALLPSFVHAPGGLAWPLVGALAVFFLVNLRGRVFAGDAGSQSLGFFAAAMPLSTMESPPALAAAALVSLPLLDLAVVVLLRARTGIPPWRATPIHFGDRTPWALGFTAAWSAVTVATAGDLAIPWIAALGAVSLPWLRSLSRARS